MTNPVPPTKLSSRQGVEAEVREKLRRYKSTVPFHAVRARFMGTIVSTVDQVHPLEEIKQLFGGDFPAVESIDEINDIFSTFMGGLWNQLSGHQSKDNPFTLIQFNGKTTDDMLREQAKTRSMELDAFLSGFLQGREELEVTDELKTAMGVLDDLCSLYGGMVSIPINPKESQKTLDDFAENLAKLSKIAQKEINVVIQESVQLRASKQENSFPGTPLH